MLAHLALLQLPLLYLPLVVIGLGVYGSELGQTSGRVLVGGILLLPVLDRLLGARVERGATRLSATVVLLGGAVLAALAYRPIHLAYWDEDSTSQAALYAVLGVVSWFASRVGAGLVRARSDEGARGPALALVCLGAAWLPALLYPLAATLSLGAVLAFAAAATVGPTASGGSIAGETGSARLPRYVAFLLGVDVLLPVWDFQWVACWPAHLGVSLVAAAAGYALAGRLGRALLVAGVAGFLAAVLHPPFVLHLAHAALAGLALGWVLHAVLAIARRRGDGSHPLCGLTRDWSLGLVVGIALYQNLAFAGWRAALLLPLLLLLPRARAARPEPDPTAPQPAV
jgi:hypothetical protein